LARLMASLYHGAYGGEYWVTTDQSHKNCFMARALKVGPLSHFGTRRAPCSVIRVVRVRHMRSGAVVFQCPTQFGYQPADTAS
jgi:hypothetical protein